MIAMLFSLGGNILSASVLHSEQAYACARVCSSSPPYNYEHRFTWLYKERTAPPEKRRCAVSLGPSSGRGRGASFEMNAGDGFIALRVEMPSIVCPVGKQQPPEKLGTP